MANNRPINRRPWRRAPWRKSRRPASWHDGNTTGTLSASPGDNWAQLNGPAGAAASPTLRELFAGDTDALYLDREEVRLDRIVGDIQFWTASVTEPTLAFPPVVRFGLVVEEDPNDPAGGSTGAAYNLFEAVALRDVEWMYLEEPSPSTTSIPFVEGSEGITGVFRDFHWHSHLDIRVKRKLGKADRLWLVMMYANGNESVPGSNNWGSPVFESHMLRGVLVA